MERDDIVSVCFCLGLKQTEIVSVLNDSGNGLSLRQLRRVLRKLNLYRRRRSNIVTVAKFVNSLMDSSSQYQGYRFVHLKCILSGILVSRETVRNLLLILDPEGVELRRRRRLVRRRYY